MGKEDAVKYTHTKSKIYEMKQTPNQLRYISEFFHSDESSVIDSNCRKAIKVDGKSMSVESGWYQLSENNKYFLDSLKQWRNTRNLIPTSLSHPYHPSIRIVARV